MIDKGTFYAFISRGIAAQKAIDDEIEKTKVRPGVCAGREQGPVTVCSHGDTTGSTRISKAFDMENDHERSRQTRAFLAARKLPAHADSMRKAADISVLPTTKTRSSFRLVLPE